MINIGISHTDNNYRYRMPAIQVNHLGKKTVIENLSDVARSLQTNPEYITRFFGLELGTAIKVDRLNGIHQARTLQGLLDKFIQMYILCDGCVLPETNLIPKSDGLWSECMACGQSRQMKNNHRLNTFIVQHPPTLKIYITKIPIVEEVSIPWSW